MYLLLFKLIYIQYRCFLYKPNNKLREHFNDKTQIHP